LSLTTLLTDQDTLITKTANSKNNDAYQAWWITHFGGMDVGLLTPRTIDQARQRLEEEKKSAQTIHHYLKFLRFRLSLAQRDGLIEHSPFERRKLPAIHNQRTRFYSEDERRRLYEALGPEWREAAELAGITGLRWSEQFTLTRDQIHLEEGYIELHTSKAGRPQARLLNQRARQIITDQLARHHSPWLYPNTIETNPIDPNNFRRRHWQPACEAAGVTNAKWNDWRHTFASDLTMAGHSDRTVAALLGHTSTAMVQRYAHLADAHLRQAVETVSNKRPTPPKPPPQKQRK
jgi:site-specific recombinase XerD